MITFVLPSIMFPPSVLDERLGNRSALLFRPWSTIPTVPLGKKRDRHMILWLVPITRARTLSWFGKHALLLSRTAEFGPWPNSSIVLISLLTLGTAAVFDICREQIACLPSCWACKLCHDRKGHFCQHVGHGRRRCHLCCSIQGSKQAKETCFAFLSLLCVPNLVDSSRLWGLRDPTFTFYIDHLSSHQDPDVLEPSFHFVDAIMKV